MCDIGSWQELCHWSIWLAWSLGEVTRCNSGGMVTVCQWPFHQGPVMACQNMLRGSTLQCCRWLIVLCLTEPAVLVTYPLVSFKWKSVFEKKKVPNLNFHLTSCFTPQQMKLWSLVAVGWWEWAGFFSHVNKTPQKTKCHGTPDPPTSRSDLTRNRHGLKPWPSGLVAFFNIS